MDRKLGELFPLVGEGERGPRLTQCDQGRGLPACQVSSGSIQPFGHNTPTLQTDRQTDRQDRTGQTDNAPIAQGEPFEKRSPNNLVAIVHLC